jgi:hypothetical protein
MTDELGGRQMGEWQAASLALAAAVVVAAIAWIAIDPDGASVAADASTRFWNTLHEQQFLP